MEGSSRYRPVFGLAAAIAAVTGGQVAAQGLEEIIVTAERRESSLQQTPISVAAFSSEALELKGIQRFDDLATFTPNLDIKGSRGSGDVSPTYQIRGLSGGGGATGERSAALYIDGIYMPRTTGPFLDVLDMERIEVLRGPQGTLFGRNSTGGAIRVFTEKPGPERDGYVKLTGGSFSRFDLSGMVNMPLSDNVFLRLQGAALEQDGYVTRGSQELGSSEDTIGRIQLAFEPSNDLRIDLSYSIADSKSEGNPQDLGTFDMNPDLNFEGNRADWVSDFLEAAGEPRIDPNNDPRIVLDDYTMPDWCFLDDADPDWDAACEQSNDADLDIFAANITWDISDTLALTSITGFTDYSTDGSTDWVMLGTEHRPSIVESEVVYQEVQLNLNFGDRGHQLVTGFSYFQEDSRDSGPTFDRRGTSVYPAAANGNGVAMGSGPNGLFRTGDTDTRQDSESWGLFANLTFNVTDRLAVTPGVRFASDEKTVTSTEYNSDDFTAFPTDGDSTTVVAPYDESDTDWRLTVDYDINDNNMVYVTASKSFRAGALSLGMGGIREDIPGDQQSAQFAEEPPFTPPESVRNNEIGWRTEFADGRVRLNLTYFDMEYSDRQAPVQELDPNSPTGFRIVVVDSGDVDLSGFELEGQVAATDNLLFDFSAGLLDPTLYDECANNGDFLFPGPAEESFSVGMNYSMPLAANLLTFALNYAWVGEQNTHPGGTEDAVAKCGPPGVAGWFLDSRYRLPDYGLLNGRVRYSTPRWDLTVFGNNLTDETYANYATRFGGGFWDSVAPFGPAAPMRSALGNTQGRPREFGVSFQYNFGASAN